MFTILLHICFLLFIFPIPPYINWNSYLICNKVQFLCNFHFLMWLLLLMSCPLIGPFNVQESGLPLSVSGSWWGSMCRAHFVLQELQAIAMMLHRMAFHLSGNVVALHLDNSTAKAYLCNQGDIVSPFLSRLACQILSQTDKSGITLYSSIHSYPPQCEGQLSVLGLDASRVASSWGGSIGFSPLGFSRGGPAGILFYHSMPVLLHLGISTTSGGLGVECLQPSLDISGKLHVSSYISSSSSVLAEYVKGQLRCLLLVASCWIEVPWLPTVLNMMVDIPQWCPIIKHLIIDVSVGQALKGLPYIHLTLWLLSDVCYADRGSLPQSVRQGQLQHLCQRSTSSVGRNGQVDVLNSVYQTMPLLHLN